MKNWILALVALTALSAMAYTKQFKKMLYNSPARRGCAAAKRSSMDLSNALVKVRK